MEVVALVCSFLAVVVSGLAAWYTRREATAAHELQRIESQRRHEERTPRVQAKLDRVDGDPWVRFENRGPTDIDELRWELKVDTARHALVGLGAESASSGQLGPMAIGAARSLSAELDSSAPSSGTATIVARCEVGVERWTLAIQVDVHRVDRPQFRWA